VGVQLSLLRVVGDHASFRTPRATVLNFSAILLLLALLPTDRLGWVPVRSVWENVFHFKPYSSGMMRALSRLLHGDFQGSLAYNRLAIPVLAVILGLVAVNARRWWRETNPASSS
jgi:hypothetical protein